MSFFTKIRKSFNEPVVIRVKTKKSFAIGNMIFSGKDRNEPDVMVHELVHVDQQKGINNPFINPSWLLRYFFDKDFRWRKEKEAVRKQIVYRQSNSIATDYGKLYNSIIEDYAKMVDPNTARQFIIELQSTDVTPGSVYL